MTHKKEIERWANCPDGTKVWVRGNGDSKGWFLFESIDVIWNKNFIYIVDDEYAELRKAEADGKTIQMSNRDRTDWVDWDKPSYTRPAIEYRIKSEDIYYYQWEQLNENQDVIEISNFINSKMGNLLKSDGWRRIESSKRTWDK